MTDNTLLLAHLSLCVPLEVVGLQRHGGPDDWQIERARERLRLNQEEGISEAVMFSFESKGATQRATTRLVEALAVLAFQPGGVRFLGLHFDATRHGWMKEVSS